MRILLATFGSLGDIHPVIGLGLELQRRGHRVAVLTSEYHRERIGATGLGFHPSAPDLRPDDKALVEATLDERRGPEEVVRFMLRDLPRMYADYERAVAAERADLLVTSDLAYAGPILAEKAGLRWASQTLSPIGFFSPYDETVLPPAPWLSKLHALGPGIYGVVVRAVKRAARALSTPINDFRRQLGLKPVRDPFFDDRHSPELVLAMFSPVIGRKQPDWPPQTVQTGYAFWDGDESAFPREAHRFVEAGEPPIVFTLGSAAVFNPGNFYVESAKAVKAVGRRAVMLVGPEPGPLPPADPDIGVFSYAPFSKLFPMSSVIVHPGGSGTTGQVLRAGKPMLVMPYAHDQPDNARRVERLGVARVVRRSKYTSGAVSRALADLLEHPGTAARAAELGNMVAHENGAAVAADAIEQIFSPPSAP